MKTTRLRHDAADLRLLLLRLRHYARKADWVAQHPVLDPVETVHELRVLGKRTRALLKLCHQTGASVRIAALEDAIRAGMHRLGSTRDRDVEAHLLRRYCTVFQAQHPPESGPHPSPEATAPLTAAIERAARETAQTDWSLEAPGWIREGLNANYRKARRRWKRECRTPADGNLHRWRIANKALFYQLEAMSLRGPVVWPKILRRLKSIGTCLGAARDLTLLLEHHSDSLQPGEIREVRKAYRKKRARALRLAAKTFARKDLILTR